ncbi:MAG TPA: nuclear transport factor 2 family protein, partial [Hyphomonadaceae bacterium]
MPRSVILVLLAGLLAFVQPARADDVKAAIEAGNVKMEKDYAAGDAKAIAEAYTEDGVMLPPDATVVKGREAVAKLWQSWIDDGLKNLKLKT